MAQTTMTNTLSNLQGALGSRSNNISNAKAVGGFAMDPVFISQSSTGLGGGSSLIQRNDFITKGQFVQTGAESDLSIGGLGTTGLFAIKRANGDIAYSANGSMRMGASKQLYLADGSVAMGWQLTNGALPTNTSTTSSLTPLSLLGVQSKATPTTQVGLAMNLKASQTTLAGPGGVLSIFKNQVSSAIAPTDIITPGNASAGTLHLGDNFQLKSSQDNTNYTFQYGGIAVSRQITAGQAMYGQTSPTTSFTISAAASSTTNLQQGSGITIATSTGANYTFTATSQAGAANTFQFNSMQSLVDAMNATNDLRASLDNGRIYVAPSDANLGLTFTDIGGSLLTSTLGFDPTTALAAGGTTYNFATVKELQQKIEARSVLVAALDTAGNLSFNAASALQTLQLGGSAVNKRTAYNIQFGGSVPNITAASSNRLITVQSNNHGLLAGQYVRIQGTGNANIVDGVYEVLAVTPDTFVISPTADVYAQTTAGDTAAAAAATTLVPGLPATGFTWQKLDGSNIFSSLTNAGTTIQTAIAGAPANHQIVTITYGGAFTVIDNYAVGDTILVKNAVQIKDGYYKIVTLPGGGAITLSVAQADVVQPGVAGAAIGVSAGLPTLSIQKVGSNNAAVVTNFDTLPIETIASAAGAAQSIKIYVSDDEALNKFKLNDVIALRNIASANTTDASGTVTLDNITLTKDTYYTISANPNTTTPGAMYITVQINPVATGNLVVAGTLRLGYSHNATAAGAALNNAAPAQSSLGTSFYVDYIGREYGGLGITVNQGTIGQTIVTPTIMQTPLAVTYDPANPLKNFSGGKIPSGVILQSISVIDSLGTQHSLTLSFGKLTVQNDISTWVVELSCPQKADGSYDISGIGAKQGQISYGNITFDGKGQFKGATGTIAAIQNIAWVDGAAPSNITINWGAIGGGSGVGLSQIDGDTSVTAITNNGVVPGNLNGFEFDEAGIFYATFDNGTTIAVAQVAIATFTNFNGLTQKDGYLYETPDSGAVILKTAGTGGVGQIITGGVTASAVNDTGEYLDVIDLTQASAMAVNVTAKVNAARDQLVSNLAR